METEAAGEENARGNNDDDAATEEEAGADDPAGEVAAKAAAAEAGEESGDRTDGPGAAGAPGSEEPQPGAYLKAVDGVFIKLP